VTAFALVAAWVAAVVAGTQPPRGERWKKVDDAVNKGLPQTAIEELDPIIAAALKDRAYPEAVKAVAASDRLSDGEEGVLPVLSRKVLVTESLTLPIRGPGTKEFDFAKLRQSAGSTSIRNQSFTVQMVSQPAWYAVMALPYLMEFPHECTEQTFNRLYANSLARHIGNSDPKVRRIFDLRSFFLQDRPVANEHRQAVDYWLAQAKKYWLQLPVRQSQAHLAVFRRQAGRFASFRAE